MCFPDGLSGQTTHMVPSSLVPKPKKHISWWPSSLNISLCQVFNDEFSSHFWQLLQFVAPSFKICWGLLSPLPPSVYTLLPLCFLFEIYLDGKTFRSTSRSNITSSVSTCSACLTTKDFKIESHSACQLFH